MVSKFIKIIGAKEHNLKGISLNIPKNKIVVITGPSGSGKSSLAFDTIYKESYRRYIEAISYYKRWLIEQIERPDVDIIEGLPPAICIKQWESSKNPRSTIGTTTEIYDYMRLLFSKIGKPYCPNCNLEILSFTIQEMVDQIMNLGNGKKIQILSPIYEIHKNIIDKLRKDGFTRIRLNGLVISLDEEIHMNKNQQNIANNIEVVIDRLILKDGIEKRLTDSIELALSISNGILIVDVIKEKEIFFSKKSICPKCGFQVQEISPQIFSFNNPKGACPLCSGLGVYKGSTCPQCSGTRLKSLSNCIKINGKSISELSNISLNKLYLFFDNIKLTQKESIIVGKIINEIKRRLSFIIKMDLEYLSINRSVATLSGGEEQRIRLATQLSTDLSGVLYIMDEPTIGLHPRDTIKLLNSISSLKELGNTVLIVEHEPEIIKNADYILELGPGAGEKGGKLIFQGTPKQMRSVKSITAEYIYGKRKISIPSHRRKGSGEFLTIKGAKEHNLKGIDVRIPLGTLTCITGVSGSGKSTLIKDILYPVLSNRLYKTDLKEGQYENITGIEYINKVVYVDQNPIGNTPKSNPATYTGIFYHIRNLFSMLPEAKIRGYKPSRFSLNLEGGRCETCKGDGIIKIEMDFLPDVYVVCDACNGRRFNRDTLEIKYKGISIADVLDMTVEKAFIFFKNIPPIKNKLSTLIDVGLGYIKLGQPANTLSGGEAQRLKLAKELSKKSTGKTIYILDEPTIGLHQSDIERLMHILNRLVNLGNTVIIIEHNLDVIKLCDYLIDLGPEGGDKGGFLIGSGTPEELAKNQYSYTGIFLKKIFGGDIAS